MMSTTITPARSSNRPYPYVKRRLVPSLLRAKAIHSGIAVAASPKLWMVSERRAIEPESTTTMICTRAVAKRATNDHLTAHIPRSEVAMEGSTAPWVCGRALRVRVDSRAPCFPDSTQRVPGNPGNYSPTFREGAFCVALCALEHLPPKVGVETIVEGVCVAGEYFVV